MNAKENKKNTLNNKAIDDMSKAEIKEFFIKQIFNQFTRYALVSSLILILLGVYSYPAELMDSTSSATINNAIEVVISMKMLMSAGAISLGIIILMLCVTRILKLYGLYKYACSKSEVEM